MAARIVAALVVALGAGCASGPSPPVGRASAWPEAETLFRANPRWLGADGALSVPLAPDRTLWLFGDTFVATSARNVRTESEMVRNTVAVQRGADPTRASMSFHWATGADGTPASFFAERGDRWHWPGHGVRLTEGPLLVWLYVLRATPGQGLGFAEDGWRLVVIDNPDDDPSMWRLRWFDGPSVSFDAAPATAVLREGEHVVGLAIRQHGTHAGYLVRWRVADLMAGELGRAEWWVPSSGRWSPVDRLESAPTPVIDDAGAECSLHFDGRRYVHVASYGFGASTIGVRVAASLTGPWSAPATVYTPPESSGPRPFVYAAKGHPELAAPAGELVVTYATNSFEFGDLFTAEGQSRLYWPRMVRVRIEP